MTDTGIVRVALRFVNEINRHDVDGMLALMSDDHLYVDGLGREVHGREKLRGLWGEVFARFPDYHLDVRETFQTGRVVALLGSASGTVAVNGQAHAQNRWTTPAAWRVIVEQDRIVHWQLYADLDPVRRLESRGVP